jgi:chromosomal replication initiator protein
METIKEAWSGVLDYLRAMPDLSEVGFNTWISPLEPRSIEGDTMVFYVESGFQRQVILGQYEGKIKKAIWEVLGLQLDLKIIAGDDASAQPQTAEQA